MPQVVSPAPLEGSIAEYSHGAEETVHGFDEVAALTSGVAEITDPSDLVIDGTFAGLMGVSAYLFTRHLLNDFQTARRDKEFTKRIIPRDPKTGPTKIDYYKPYSYEDGMSTDAVASTKGEARKRRKNDIIAGAVGALATGVTFLVSHGN